MASADEPPDLTDLPDSRLLDEYEAAGLAIQNTYALPTDQPIARTLISGTASTHKAISRFHAARHEILRRGEEIVPELIAFLRREVPLERMPAPDAIAVPGFVGDAIALLVEINDPRAADALVEILAGFDGKASTSHRAAALDALEKLTHCSFRKVRPLKVNYGEAVEHQDAREEDDQFQSSAAKLYRAWLDGEGKDPTGWLSLARVRARAWLASDDPDKVYCAAAFLRQRTEAENKASYDDKPAETMDRLAEVMSQLKPTDDPYYYSWNGQTARAPIGNWMLLLGRYGTDARRHASVLIRLQTELGLENWGGFALLGEVGGPEITHYLFACLPNAQDDSLSTCRMAIDRCAGRSFQSDEQRLAWWKANQSRFEEEP
jgi:hypothetical protein